jgi:hypothetical protein
MGVAEDLARNAMGNVSPDERSYIPESEVPKAIFAARVHMAIYAATAAVSLWMLAAGMGWRALIPFMIIGLPRIYGCWHFIMTGLLQHGGLAENVVDHRLNTRTVYMNPVSPLDLLEHELPRGASHVSHGALLQSSQAPRAHQARPATARPVDLAGVQAYAACCLAAAERPRFLYEARASADCEAVSAGPSPLGAGARTGHRVIGGVRRVARPTRPSG